MSYSSTPMPERFWTKVAKAAPNDCWLWTARQNGKGYGMFGNACAHRVSYELIIGPIPLGLQIDHLCRVRACVNPAHLEPVTPAENTRRALALITHCPQGHAYNVANTYWRTNTAGRKCRVCRACGLAWYHAHKVLEAAGQQTMAAS